MNHSAEKRTSELFRDPSADIAFVSSDNVLFKIHRGHIDLNSLGFSISDNTLVDSDPVQLSEPFKTLEILFQFIESPPESRNYRQPSVTDMQPSLFFDVAEAAEKYVVYSAMNTFITWMQVIVSQHPLEVLNHSARHGYAALADQAAEYSLSQPLNIAASKIADPDVLRRWLIYYSNWREAGKDAIAMFEQTDVHNCVVSAHIYTSYLRQINEEPRFFLAIPSTPENSTLQCTTTKNPLTCPCKNMKDIISITQLSARQHRIPKFNAIAI